MENKEKSLLGFDELLKKSNANINSDENFFLLNKREALSVVMELIAIDLGNQTSTTTLLEHLESLPKYLSTFGDQFSEAIVPKEF